MWISGGQCCSSLDPCAIEDLLHRAAPVPLWQSQCSILFNPFSGLGDTGGRNGVRLRNQQFSVPGRKLSGLGWVAGWGQ